MQRVDALSILFHADDRPTIFRRLLLECLRGKSPPTENAGQ